MTDKIDNEKWMLKAVKQAEIACSIDEVPIGCVIVNDNKIIGLGYNQVEQLNDSTAHAEMIAITSASNYIQDWRLNDCSIYVTKEPCKMCFGAIVNSRIRKLYYGFSDEKNGFSIQVKSQYLLNGHLEKIDYGILESRCKYLVENFFINKRKKQ